MNIGPEFLHDQGYRIERQLGSPSIDRVGQGLIGGNEQVRVPGYADVRARGMVAVGRDRCGGGGAENLGIIKLLVAGIAPGHKNAADRIPRAPKKSALSRLVVARVLVKGGGKNRAHHEVLNHAVACRDPEALGISCPPLPEGGLTIVRLAYSGQHRPPGILHIIERSQGHNLVFVLSAQRRKLALVLKREEIRQRIEQTIVRSALDLSACVRRVLTFVRGLLRRWSCWEEDCSGAADCGELCCGEVVWFVPCG